MNWHNPKTNPPPHYTSVLIAVRDEEISEQAFRTNNGFGEYKLQDGHFIDPSDVYAWTELPKCPTELEVES